MSASLTDSECASRLHFVGPFPFLLRLTNPRVCLTIRCLSGRGPLGIEPRNSLLLRVAVAASWPIFRPSRVCGTSTAGSRCVSRSRACWNGPWGCGFWRRLWSSGMPSARGCCASFPTRGSTGSWPVRSARDGPSRCFSGASRTSPCGRRAIPCSWPRCQLGFGDRVLPVRLVQAALGTLSVWLVDRLVRPIVSERPQSNVIPIPITAAILAAIDPFQVGTSVLVLSEALFIPLMLANLWGLARLWPGSKAGEAPRAAPLLSLATGLANGAAVLVRPSWVLFVPALLLGWLIWIPGSSPRWSLHSGRCC